MKQKFRKAAAALLAAATLCGGLPFTAWNGWLHDAAIAANAADVTKPIAANAAGETKPIAVGTTYYFDDMIAIGGDEQNLVYFRMDDQSDYLTKDYGGWWKLSAEYVDYDSGANQYYIDYSDETGIMGCIILTAAANDTAHDPASIAGIQCVGGSGTADAPYTFAPVFPPSFKVGDVIRFGDTVDLGSGWYGMRDDTDTTDPVLIQGNQELIYDHYYANIQQHAFLLDDYLIFITSDCDSRPYGIKVTGGTGTEADPYTFAPAFPTELTAENITLADTALPYTGKKVKPGVTVTVNGQTLTEGTDYTLGYSSNVNLGYRTAKAVITGIGAYTGTVRVPFSIVPAQQAAPTIAFDGTTMTVSWAADANATGYKVTVSKSSTLNAAAKSTQTQTVTGTSATFTGMADGETWYAAVTAYVTNENAGIMGEIAKQKLEVVQQPITKAVFASGAVEYEYTGKAIMPAMTVKCGSTVLTEGVDYTVTYKKNKAVGYKTATTTVTGIGKYSGSITKKFTIIPATQAAPTVKATNSGKLWVKWAEDASAVGYEVVISKSSTLNAAAKSTVSTIFAPGTTTNSFAEPTSGETWYVAVRSVISDDGTTAGTLYGNFSEIVKIKMP